MVALANTTLTKKLKRSLIRRGQTKNRATLEIGAGAQTYHYNALGMLDSTTGVDGTHHALQYDAAGRLVRRASGASVVETRTYDWDDHVATRSNNKFSDAFTYDARGKLTQAVSGLTYWGVDSSTMVYDGFGALMVHNRVPTVGTATADEFQADGFGNVVRHDLNRGLTDGRSATVNSFSAGRMMETVADTLPGVTDPDNGSEPLIKTFTDMYAVFDSVGNQTQTNTSVSTWQTTSYQTASSRDGDRDDVADAAQGLQCADHHTHRRWRGGDRGRNRRLEVVHAIARVIDLVEIGEEGHLLRGLGKLQSCEPVVVAARPRRHPRRTTSPLTQEKLAEPMPRPQLILFRCFPRAHEIPQRLLGGIGHVHRRELAGAITTRELERIAAIRLHAIARFRRDQRRRDHLAGDAKLRQLPVEHVPAGPGFIADPQLGRRAERAQPLGDRLRTIGNDPEAPRLARRVRDRHRDRLGVDVESHMAHIVH